MKDKVIFLNTKVIEHNGDKITVIGNLDNLDKEFFILNSRNGCYFLKEDGRRVVSFVSFSDNSDGIHITLEAKGEKPIVQRNNFTLAVSFD